MQFYDGFLAICDNFGPSQMTRFLVVLGEHDRQIICHYVTVSPGGTCGDLIELHPLLGISLAIVGINPEDLDAYGPLYCS